MLRTATRYAQYSTLTGARDAVLSLSFSAHGAFIAATGYDGVRVWDLSFSTSAPILATLPHQVYNPQNPKFVFTASIWLYFERTNSHVLVLGTLRRGYPVLEVQRNREKQREVASGSRGRIAAVTMDQCVTVWSLSASDVVTKIFSCKVQDFVPKAVRFHTESRDLFLFARSGGGIQLLDAKTGQVKSKDFRGPPVLGSVALSTTNETFVSWTGESFQLFRLVGLELLQTFATGRPMVYFPRNIVFGEQDRIVVGGTDRGCGHIFQVDDPNQTQILEYPKGGLVQHVATASLPDRHLVAIAGSSRHQAADVVVFQKFIKKGASVSIDRLDWQHFSFYLPRKLVQLMTVIILCVGIWAGISVVRQDVYFSIFEYIPKAIWPVSQSMPDPTLVCPPAPACDTMPTRKPIEASLSNIAAPEQENFILIGRVLSSAITFDLIM
ncbi:hypothetical protein BT96DRAFT_948685 [Gymnopus androsaceus JB14]|uniref:WD40 repeat-like protein n=1 Tax=Gymnopus androsaceus JB14 TaxID=1447944 RepID=A0A6A4GNV3_9AGAR|nr:hypothetical protein BT96DRAFT_948685 [Gymnopus androsaceus JB14]